jgi:hypothetical protein
LPLDHVSGHAGDSSSSSCHNVSSVRYQSTPCCSDQGADLGHIRGLDAYIAGDVGWQAF